jgi:benzoyl-CoA reductase/2-hydroxyglutaryl-CoA dehydratase subunit BcrC/BadD/HgdB
MSAFKEDIEEFAKISRAYPSEVLRQKRGGRKAVCYYGSRVPVEIVHASGAVPYPLFDGGDATAVEAALPYLLRFANAQALYQVGQHALGLNPIIPVADCIIIDCKEADSVRVGNVFEFLDLPVWNLAVPQDWESEIAFNFYQRQLTKLKEKLEQLTGERITNDKLVQSIEKYNLIRESLSQISELRKEQPAVTGGEEFIKLNHYALRSDLDVAIRSLGKICGHLKLEKGRFPERAARIMVAGRGFALGDYTLLKMIEESGGVVVTEFLDEGILHAGKVKVDGDPMVNIAQMYYRDMVPSCLFTPSWAVRWKQVDRLLDEYRAKGILYYMLSFDTIYDLEYTLFSKRADEKRIPFEMIESSYDFSREATESLRTRVESFIKICRR